MSPRGGAVEKTVVLIGNSGNDKCATGNKIIGRQVFDSLPSSGGVLSTCQFETTTLDDGQILNVINTPGFIHSSVGKFEMAKGIVECINMAKDGIHAFLIVLSLGKGFSEEASTLESLCQIFGGKIVDYMIVGFTDSEFGPTDWYMDNLRRYFPRIFKIIKSCGNIFVSFYNTTEDEDQKYRQRKQLLSLVENVVERNGGKPYTNDLLDVLKRRDMNLIYQPPEGKSYEGTFHALNEEQFDRFTEMVESRLKESIQNLEKPLADERAARMGTKMRSLSLVTKLKDEALELKICLNKSEESRKQLEERLHRAETIHTLEKQLAEERASRLEVETKLKGLELKECLNSAEESCKQLEERLHRVEKQLAEESVARMEAEMKALAVQTKSKDDILELKECFNRAEESREQLKERLDKVDSTHTLEKQFADEERASRLNEETKSKGEVLELKKCMGRDEESHKQLEMSLQRVEKQLAKESADRLSEQTKSKAEVHELKECLSSAQVFCNQLDERLDCVESRLDVEFGCFSARFGHD